jgi:NAD-reducing hydrogenase large subunit
MKKQVVIEPVTRVEGHAKISLYLDETGEVVDARFHVNEFRGFEQFCVGRPFREMPSITARICGICPVSHILASSKACDNILSVEIPKPAEKLRRLMNLGQIIQSHALSFFHLSSPDLILGWDTPKEQRNIFGLIQKNPELARNGIKLRQFGQEIIQLLGGRKIHPAWSVAGGVRESLSQDSINYIKSRLPEALEIAKGALKLFKSKFKSFESEFYTFGNFPSYYMGLVDREGNWEHYDGCIRIVDSMGNIIADKLNPENYQQFIGEAVEDWSYLKFPYYKPLGYPAGIYRVGPLARLNVCKEIGTDLADKELIAFRKYGSGSVNSAFFYHYARLIEILACIEKINMMIDDPDLTSKKLKANAGVNQQEAVGCSEAPRGILFHHYKVDENGLITFVNLIIATGQNNLAMNRTILQIARNYIHSHDIPEPLLNKVEAGIRAYDPCLSCSTHAFGMMPMKIELIDKNGNIVAEKTRN